jgi:acetylornithine deacetylase/succinyl-diaminopimelate desuccinylase-like protein
MTLSRRTLLQNGAGAALWTLAGRTVLTGSTGQAAIANKALAMAEDRRQELVELLTRLVAIRSHSGETAEAAQAEVVRYLEQHGYRAEQSADRPSRFADHAEFMPPNPPGDGPFVNVIGRPRDGLGRELALFAHIDTEPAGDGWTTPPYQLVQKDGRLHGLGSADDKGGVAAMLVAAAALRDSGGGAPIVMSLHGKGGGSRGSLPVFARTPSLRAVLYVHPAETGRGMADIKHVVRGALDMTLAVRGWRSLPREIGSPDSAPYAEGGNALQACWGAFDRLRNRALAGCDVNIGRLEAGDRVGSVPDQAQAQFRVLFDEPKTWRALVAGMERELSAFLSELPSGRATFTATLSTTGLRTNPGAVDWDGPACLSLRQAITNVTGSAPLSYTGHYAGDIRYPIRLLGAPAFGVGSRAGNFSGPNEWVDVDDLVRLVAVVIQTVSAWAKL